MDRYVTTRLLITITLLLLPWLPLSVYGDSQQSDESLVKAVFIYNFAKFTRWPDHDRIENGSLKICSFGEDALTEALLRLNGRRLKDHPVAIEHRDDDLRLDSCHVLYLARSTADQFEDITRSLRSAPVLTVSEIPEFSELGGMIELYRFDGKIRFKINLQAVRDAGLDLSSRLLKLAVIVHRQH